MSAGKKVMYCVMAKMKGMHMIPSGKYEIDVTQEMFEIEAVTHRPILSDRARKFIEDNDLGDFHLRLDAAVGWLKMVAPNDYARVIFRTAF